MIVVDANITVYFWIPSERTAMMEEVFQKDPHWVVPLLWRSEMRNVLWQYIQLGKLPLTKAQQIMEKAQANLLSREYQVVSDRVLELAAQSRCSSYDCEYIVLANQLDVLLITVDKALLKAFPKTACSPKDFLQTYD